jgi:Tfp pilus assembly protein PilV
MDKKGRRSCKGNEDLSELSRRGISLTEVAIVVGVVSVSLLYAMRAFYSYTQANVYTNEKAIETVLATERIEEWKVVGGDNFVPGVQIPTFSKSVDANGVITFTRTLTTVPATTSLDVDCTTNTVNTQAAGYSYTLTQGTYGDAGSGNNCWFNPSTRAPGDHTAGNVKFSLTVPSSVSCTLSLNLVDLGTKLREERVIVNNVTKASYTAAQLVPPTGQTCTVNLTSNDTSSGTINVEIEQTNTTYEVAGNVATILDDCNDTGWTRFPSSIVRTVVATSTTTPPAITYSESDSQCLYISAPGSSGEYIYRNFNTSTASAGDSISAWIRFNADTSGGCQAYMSMPGGVSNTVTSATSGWQQMTKVLTASDIGASIRVYIYFGGLSLPNTNDRFHLNELLITSSTTTNPNAVISSFTLQSLTGFSDTSSNPPYVITSSLTPADSVPGAALGWIVTTSVSKTGSSYQPVTISNTINR